MNENACFMLVYFINNYGQSGNVHHQMLNKIGLLAFGYIVNHSIATIHARVLARDVIYVHLIIDI